MASTERPIRPPVVLVATDQEWSARSLESILAPNGFAVLRAHSGHQALEMAYATKPDAVILDTTIGDPTALEVCQQLRDGRGVSPSTPVVITAPQVAGRRQRLDAFAAGAWQFCSQPIDGEALLRQLRTFLQAKREADRIREQNLIDEDTGLYSITGLVRRAVEIGANAQRQRLPFACIAFEPRVPPAPPFIKEGMVSRRLVEHIANLCRRTGRASDALGRIGQCEFAIVAPLADSFSAVRVLERLQSALDSAPLFEGAPQLPLRAGYHHVSNFAESPIDAIEMLLRAATALRHVRGGPAGQYITAFDQITAAGAP